MTYKYSATSSHTEIPQETPTCKCSMCGEEVSSFFVGWTMDEYQDDNRVCEEWNCWQEFATYHESSIPFEDYVDNPEDIDQEDWSEAVQEWLWNQYDIVKSTKWK